MSLNSRFSSALPQFQGELGLSMISDVSEAPSSSRWLSPGKATAPRVPEEANSHGLQAEAPVEEEQNAANLRLQIQEATVQLALLSRRNDLAPEGQT